jgi:cyclin H
MTSTEEKTLTPKMQGVDNEIPHRVTNDELYRRSSQYRYWSFTEDEISDLRIRANKRGEEIFQKRIQGLSDDSNSILKQYINEEFKNINEIEEREIIIYYARKCQDLSNFFKFTTQVRLTAISYLFKFYLIHSIMEYYPQQIMYTCLFLSAKSENNFIGINNFSKAIPKTTPESILKYEYLILETMRFSLTCHHPMKSMYGFYLDIQNVLIKLDFNRLFKDYESCQSIINESIFTDVQFLFTPPQIALAALYIVDDVVCMRYLMRKFGVKKKQMIEMMKDNEDSDKSTPTIKEEQEEKEEINYVDGDNVDQVNIEKKDNEKKMTPLEHFEKVMNVVKQCALKMQVKIDPSVQEAKIISLRAHFCLDPVKYFKKISKDATPMTMTMTMTSESPSSITPLKRENEDNENNNDIQKRVKID